MLNIRIESLTPHWRQCRLMKVVNNSKNIIFCAKLDEACELNAVGQEIHYVS